MGKAAAPHPLLLDPCPRYPQKHASAFPLGSMSVPHLPSRHPRSPVGASSACYAFAHKKSTVARIGVSLQLLWGVCGSLWA